MSVSESILSINLEAVAANWSVLNSMSDGAECAAVVKADAYGLGVQKIAPVLYARGCRHFFVSTLAEAEVLSAVISSDASIYLLSGVARGEELTCIERAYVPVLISMEMVDRWVTALAGRSSASVLKVDTGMHRLGLSYEETEALLEGPDRLLERANVGIVMSHLACADESGHVLNQKQLDRFSSWRSRFLRLKPDLKFSLANSGGIALGKEYLFDIVRPGIAMYGGQVGLAGSSVIAPVVELKLKLMCSRELGAGETVGYGATGLCEKPSTIASYSGGYADGMPRSLSNIGVGYIHGVPVPLMGRVSMDTTCFDITAVRDQALSYGWVEVLGRHQGIDQLAAQAGAVAYEVLTGLGSRFTRCYVGDDKVS